MIGVEAAWSHTLVVLLVISVVIIAACNVIALFFGYRRPRPGP